jgi:hypothetical protein
MDEIYKPRPLAGLEVIVGLAADGDYLNAGFFRYS